MRNKKGIGFILSGLILLSAAIALLVYNVEIQKAAGIATQDVMDQLVAEVMEENSAHHMDIPIDGIPDYVLNPNMDMTEKEINGGYYIAILSIPSLELEFPVNTEWNYANLKTSPCRYSGSAYTGDLIVCAHNYDIHFGRIKYLNAGDSVILTDMDGNVFQYEVVETETLDSYAVEQMESGEWDLTFFTCTIGGATRITVRCVLI